MKLHSWETWVVVRDDGDIVMDDEPEPFFMTKKEAKSLAAAMTRESKWHPAYDRPAKYSYRKVNVALSAARTAPNTSGRE